MSAQLFLLPFRPAIGPDSLIIPGAQLNFFQTTTLTRANVYTDSTLSTPLPNPVVANSAGVWPAIYFDNTVTYRVQLLAQNGAILKETDPYLPGVIDGLSQDLLNQISNLNTVANQVQGYATTAGSAKDAAVAAANTVSTALSSVTGIQDHVGGVTNYTQPTTVGYPVVSGSALPSNSIWADSNPLPGSLLGNQSVYIQTLGNGKLSRVLLSPSGSNYKVEVILPLTAANAGVNTFVAGTDFPANVHASSGWIAGWALPSGGAQVAYNNVSGANAPNGYAPSPSVGDIVNTSVSSGTGLSSSGIYLTPSYVIEDQLRTTQSVVNSVKPGFFKNVQRIGYPGYSIPDGNNQLPNLFFGTFDPVLDDGFLVGVAVYARASGPLTIQRYRIVSGLVVFVGSQTVVNVPATGYQYITLPTPVPVLYGDYLTAKGSGIIAWIDGSGTDRADGGGTILNTITNGQAIGDPQFNARIHLGFDISSHSAKTVTDRNLITIRYSDKILADKNSYWNNLYGLRGKAVSQQIADQSEWRFENFSIAGFGVAQLLTSARAGDLSRGYTRLLEVNPTYVISGEMTNSYVASISGGTPSSITEYFNIYRQLIETSKSVGATVILPTEHNPLFVNGGSELSTSIIWKLARDHGAIPLSLRENSNVFGPKFGGYGTDYTGWNNGDHPGTRYQDIIVSPYLNLIETQLGRPEESLRIFRPRPAKDGTAPIITDISTLLYEPDDLITRTALLREIDHGHGGLNDANEKNVDSINSITNNNSQTTNLVSEYLSLQVGNSIPFTSAAVIEAILPANGKNCKGVGVYVSDPTCKVYVRSTVYYDNTNPGYPGYTSPTGRWQPIGIDSDGFARVAGGNLPGVIHQDKVIFLVTNANTFSLTEPAIEWYGTRGKVKSPLRSNSRPRGAALVANPYVAASSALASGWVTSAGTPTFGTGLTSSNMLPRGATGDVRVTTNDKIAADLSWAADQFHDREIEIEVWASGVRPLVDPSASYPSAASVTRYTNDLETLVVEIVSGSNTVPHKVAIPQYHRRTRIRTVVAAGTTGFRLQLSSATNPVAITFAQATFVDG